MAEVLVYKINCFWEIDTTIGHPSACQYLLSACSLRLSRTFSSFAWLQRIRVEKENAWTWILNKNFSSAIIKIGRTWIRSPICQLRCMTTDGKGRDEVLLPIYLNITIWEDTSHNHRASKVNIVFTYINLSLLLRWTFFSFFSLSLVILASVSVLQFYLYLTQSINDSPSTFAIPDITTQRSMDHISCTFKMLQVYIHFDSVLKVQSIRSKQATI